MKKRILPTTIALIIVTICTIISLKTGINPPTINIIGSYLSVFLVAFATLKFPQNFFIWALTFDMFATAFGSVLNLYRTIGCYDKIVHFMSGVLAAVAGKMIIEFILKKKRLPKTPLIIGLFALLFAFSCAGLWEVYEFSADFLIKTHMQGGLFDTMTDIISGILGGIVFVGISAATQSSGRRGL